MMKTRLIFCTGLVLYILNSNAIAQPTVQYMKDEDITRDNLINILSGQSSEGELRTRGIRPTDKSTRPAGAQCAAEQRRTRGIQPVAVSDYAAMAIRFDFNSATLSPQAEKTLNILADALKADQLRSSSFDIEGHTDNIGGQAYNQQLSEARAKSVVVYLLQRHGIEAVRLTPMGCGAQYPIEKNNSESGRQMNRRVQIQAIIAK
jgi:outer membrane protein OmpA-like peptidoglycan-associated protein